ncbi:Smoothelin-Like Protein 2 [Manis pentadactyla]|nr:Smoothelin-Like Protein 2 [Manis pentadactyla]
MTTAADPFALGLLGSLGPAPAEMITSFTRYQFSCTSCAYTRKQLCDSPGNGMQVFGRRSVCRAKAATRAPSSFH